MSYYLLLLIPSEGFSKTKLCVKSNFKNFK